MSDLRAIAEAATPGPWRVGERPALSNGVWADGFTSSPDEDGVSGHLVAWCHSEWRDEADAAHIAAWHPGRALAALDVIEAARSLVECRMCSRETGTLCDAHRPALRAALDRWDAQG
jgi:hypothetical protein